jgi:cytochrome P450
VQITVFNQDIAQSQFNANINPS